MHNKIVQIPISVTYLTEEEAVEHVENNMKDVFCPIIKDMCRMDCVCYEKAGVANVKNNGVVRWYVEDGFCSNAMFVGYEGE